MKHPPTVRWLAALAVFTLFALFAAWAETQAAQDRQGALSAANAKAAQTGAESRAAAKALKDADAKAAALEQARAEAEADVTDAAKKLAQTKTAATQLSAKLTEWQTKTEGQDDFDTTRKLKQQLQEISQLMSDERAAMDAKIVALSQIAEQAKAAKQAAADAMKLAVEKAAAAGKAAQDAKVAASDAKVAGNARKWLANSLAESKKGHFTAVVEVATGDDKPLAAFRYDRFPGVERVVADDDAVFARRAGGKGWLESADWGKTGAPADAKRAAALDAMVELAFRAFQPVAADPVEGTVTWRRLPGLNLQGETMPDDYTLEQGRENPAPLEKRAPYPQFHFANCWVGDSQVLETVTALWKWNGAEAKVTVSYFYMPETAPPAGPLPEETAIEAFRAMESAPVKVEVAVTPDGAPRIRIAGIISGKDFDLTVMQGDREKTRQIAVGGDFWTSADGGATWRKQNKVDRMYYNLILRRAPGFFPERPLLWPFWVNGDSVDKGAASKRLTAMGTDLGHAGQDAIYDVEMRDGKPVLLRLCTSDPLSGNLYASFHDPADARGVLPPPANPDAVPGDSANDVLAKAVKAMDAAGVWRVEFSVRQQRENAQGVWRDTGPAQRIAGLMSGKDFDLVTTRSSGNPALERRIALGEKVWTSTGKAGAWAPYEGDAWKAPEPYDMARTPLDEHFTGWVYDIAGSETHGDETWLYIRCQGGVTYLLATDPEYWVQLDKEGKPAAVRRCIWASFVTKKAGNFRDYEEVDFTPAKEGEKIAPPEASPQGGK